MEMNTTTPLALVFSKCANLTVKFDGYRMHFKSNVPIERINTNVIMVNDPASVTNVFRQLGSLISTVSVRFDVLFYPNSDLMKIIINNIATFCTASTLSFVLMNWLPCIELPRTLMDVENMRQLKMVHKLSIYDSEWSSALMQQINRIFPNLEEFKVFRCEFEKNNNSKVDSLMNLKRLGIQCQIQSTSFQRNIIRILQAHPKLEHVSLTLNGGVPLWKRVCMQLKSLPSIQFDYFITKNVAKSIGLDKIFVEKKHLMDSPNTEQFILEFDQREGCRLDCRELVTMWVEFVIENRRTKKLDFYISHWFDEKHLNRIVENLPNLSELTIHNCNISMSNIVEILVKCQNLKKLNLAVYEEADESTELLGWSITYDDRKFDVLFEKM